VGTSTEGDAAVTTTADGRPAQAESAPVQRTLTIGHGAVLHAIEKNTVQVVVPALGTVHLPPPQTLAWFGGLAALGLLGVMEWPVVVVIGAGHLLAQQSHLRLLHDFGEALEEA
jgi:hypothetical protein